MRVFLINTGETFALNDLNGNKVEQTNKSNPCLLLPKAHYDTLAMPLSWLRKAKMGDFLMFLGTFTGNALEAPIQAFYGFMQVHTVKVVGKTKLAFRGGEKLLNDERFVGSGAFPFSEESLKTLRLTSEKGEKPEHWSYNLFKKLNSNSSKHDFFENDFLRFYDNYFVVTNEPIMLTESASNTFMYRFSKMYEFMEKGNPF